MNDENYKQISEIFSDDFVGKEVFLKGWVYRLRKQKENSFITLRDGSFDVIQAVLPTT